MKEKEFATSDLGQASYLAAIGYRVLDIRSTPGDSFRCEFVFDQEAEEDAKRYYLGATVEAHNFMMTQQALKYRLRSLGR